MGKTIKETHIIGERGVNAFADYCNKHLPYLVWRPENINDFGIDGEVELSAKNSEGKIEPTGEIIKIQIKSSETGSYIRNATDTFFDFYAKPEDIDYWKKHSLSVILIIFDVSIQQLYARKIEEVDIANTKSYCAIKFDKKANQLNIGDNSFTQKFSATFKHRINFDTQETIGVNIFKFSKLPTFIFQYESKIKSIKDVYKKFDNKQTPIFILKENKIYSFTRPEIYPKFKNFTIKDKTTKVDSIPFKQFLKNSITYLYSIELLNKTFKDFAGSKGIFFNKDYRRYYFALKHDQTERIIPYISRTKRKVNRKVVIYKKYIVTEFFRHFGFETNYLFNDEGLFLLINPKFLFTSDRKNVLENKKKITQLTNFITSREHNAQYMNHMYFLFQFLSEGNSNIVVSNFDNATVTLSKFISIPVSFGIPLDSVVVDEDQEDEEDNFSEIQFNEEESNED